VSPGTPRTESALVLPDDGHDAEFASHEAREVLRSNSRSFYFASLFLPYRFRADAALLYAFCRTVDDLADKAPNREEAAVALAHLQDELQGKRPARPVVRAFLSLSARRGVDSEAADHLIRGVASDLREVSMENDRALLRYAYQVAGTVGLMMSPLLGVKSPNACAFAIDLGMAMQLTNIARDVGEDAGMGRVYLPVDRLQVAGLRGEQLLRESVVRPEVFGVVRDLLELAETYYASAQVGMRYIPLRSRLAIAVAARVYRAIGRNLLRVGPKGLERRMVVSFPSKCLEVIRALFALIPGMLRSPPEHDRRLHAHLDGLPGAHRSPA
jgi:15-cis-phytoene synthase